MVAKIKDIKRGDLVEFALTRDAKMVLGAKTTFVKDKTGDTNIPGRTYAGYIANLGLDPITLSQDWNELDDGSSGGYLKFHLDIIESYSKAREDRFHRC